LANLTFETRRVTVLSMRIAVITTHPIQYQVPWFRALAEDKEVDARVFFSYIPNKHEQGIGFGTAFDWDIDLRQGFDNVVLRNLLLSSTIPTFFRRIAIGIGRELRTFDPDAALIMGWQEFSLLQAFIASWTRGVPIILRGDSNALKPRPAHVTALHRIYLSRASAALATGDANAEFYIQGGMPPDQIVMARHFVDNERFAKAADSLRGERHRIRAAWGVRESALCVLFAGKLEAKKRVTDVLEALRIAGDLGIDVHGLVVGTGAEMTNARRMVASLDLPVTFTGFLNQTEMPRAYVAADVVVLPSDYGETWGLVINEAMATGLPAIVSNRVGCAGDLVVDGETGAVTPFGEPSAIAQKLVGLAKNPDYRIALGRAARGHVGSHYTIALAVKALKEAVERVKPGKTHVGRTTYSGLQNR
jgi:glycosyltransferase involved in cell wall biosynthesis